MVGIVILVGVECVGEYSIFFYIDIDIEDLWCSLSEGMGGLFF